MRTIDGKAHFFHKSKFIDGAFPTFPDQGDGLKFDLEASPTKPDRTQCYNISRHEHSEEGIAPNTGHEQGIDTLKTEHEQEIEKLKATIESQSAIINANVVKHAEEVEKRKATIGKTRQERENEELEEEDQETSRAEARIQYDLVKIE